MLHLKKLSVGSESIKGLAAWHREVLEKRGRIIHVTRSFPRRSGDILAGKGSMYWVIKGWMCVRQPIVDLLEMERGDGKPACGIVLGSGLVPVVERRHRPFQGWRYLDGEDAPPDLSSALSPDEMMPREMREELHELGLL